MTTPPTGLAGLARREASPYDPPALTIAELRDSIEVDLQMLAVAVARVVAQVLELPREPLVKISRLGNGPLTATLYMSAADPSDPTPIRRHLSLLTHTTSRAIGETLRGTLTAHQLCQLRGAW